MLSSLHLAHHVTVFCRVSHTQIGAGASHLVPARRPVVGLKSPSAVTVKTRAAYSCVAAAAETMTEQSTGTKWAQKIITLPGYRRGCHVVTRRIMAELPDVEDFEVGLANFFIQHTSASLTINENASPDVPLDLSDWLDLVAPEGEHYRHLDEGLDDMPAHCKSSLLGASLTIPIAQGRLALGTWQGIYLNEHRDYGGSRRIVVTLQGSPRSDGRKYGSSRYR